MVGDFVGGGGGVAESADGEAAYGGGDAVAIEIELGPGGGDDDRFGVGLHAVDDGEEIGFSQRVGLGGGEQDTGDRVVGFVAGEGVDAGAPGGEGFAFLLDGGWFVGDVVNQAAEGVDGVEGGAAVGGRMRMPR